LARQLLSSTNLSVTKIAAALHYADPNIFSRAFRNWAGSSPKQWRALKCDGGMKIRAKSNPPENAT
jgi:AraC-like DNA-binding protein